MSLTIDCYSEGNLYAEYRWDKYEPHYQVFVGRKYEGDGLVHTLWKQTYATKEQAKRSFQRQVRKIKKGEYGLW